MKASAYLVDIINLSVVQWLGFVISSTIGKGEFPRIRRVICSAAYWNLVVDLELGVDGFDKVIQVGSYWGSMCS